MPPKKRFVFDENLSTEKFKLGYIGGEILDVDLIWCFESVFIRRELKTYSSLKIPVRVKIPLDILLMVDEFCVTRWEIMKSHHDANLLLDSLASFGLHFLRSAPLPVLVQLMDAAYELRIKSLLDLTRNAIVDWLDGERKSAEEIFKKMGKSVSTNEAMLRYSCMDGKIVHVDPRCCYESDCILHQLIDTEKKEKDRILKIYWNFEEGDIGRFPIIAKIPSHILSMVHDLCISRFDIVEAYARDDNLLSEMLEVFDSSFAQKHPLTLLVQLMHTAYELRIKSLLDLTRNAIVDRLDGKSAKEIHTIFNMPYFTHEVWVKPLTRKTWAHKQMMVV